MTEIEIVLLCNNAVYPFENLRKEENISEVSLNKLLATKSIAEHGIGFLINVYKNAPTSSNDYKYPNFTFCFDVGGPNLSYLHNFNIRGYSLSDINFIILSHWHYDHIGSLYEILKGTEEGIPVLTHESALNIRVFRRASNINNNELSGKTLDQVSHLINASKIVIQEPINNQKVKKLGACLKFSNTTQEIYSHNNLKIIASGEIPRTHDDEEFRDFFSVQNDTLQIDRILDDKFLLIELIDKAIILLGCCHSGLKNSLDYVKMLTNKPISYIIGGFHMAHATKERIESTIRYLLKYNSNNERLLLFPIHCSGFQLQKSIENLINPTLKAFNVGVGTVFNFHSV